MRLLRRHCNCEHECRETWMEVAAEMKRQRDAAEGVIEAARAPIAQYHAPNRHGVCRSCHRKWPCPTRRLRDAVAAYDAAVSSDEEGA